MTDGPFIDPGDPPIRDLPHDQCGDVGPHQEHAWRWAGGADFYCPGVTTAIGELRAEASAAVIQPNKLENMLREQRDAQINVHQVDLDGMTDEDRIAFIAWNVLALENELHEALGEVGWKPWATSRHINREAFVGELADALHFVLNLYLVVGADADEMYQTYLKKRQLNTQRQAEGYDGVSTKCPGCGRALDDPATECFRVVDGVDDFHCVDSGFVHIGGTK